MTNTGVPDGVPTDVPPVSKGVVRAWSLWDFGQQSFNTVILTFVFSVYVTGLATTDAEGTQIFTATQFVAGVLIALLAPALGTYSDRLRNSRLFLTLTTALTIASMAALWFVEPEYEYLLFGCVMIAVASVFSELAGVFYNGMLLRISTPATFGRISGTAWGLGYIGGVIALVVTLFVFVGTSSDASGLLGLPTEGAVHVRAVALLCAGWFAVFGLPLLLLAPKDLPAEQTARISIAGSYVELGRRLRTMWRTQRPVLNFFIASAVYRDGLASVFTIAGVLAAGAYGFPRQEVIVFGLAANLVAGVSTWLSGKVDDVVGPRKVIVASLVAIIAVSVVIIASDARIVFWVGGLLISACVGPIQSASRSMLARMTSASAASESFGLYATTGRAVSWLGPGAAALFVTLTGNERLSIIGIVLVLALGLVLFLTMTRASSATPVVTDESAA